MEYEPRETYNIYSLNMFLYIIKKGIYPVGTKQQAENPSKTIFFFEDTPEVRQAAQEYVKNKEK